MLQFVQYCYQYEIALQFFLAITKSMLHNVAGAKYLIDRYRTKEPSTHTYWNWSRDQRVCRQSKANIWLRHRSLTTPLPLPENASPPRWVARCSRFPVRWQRVLPKSQNDVRH